MHQTFYIDVDEEITSLVDKLRKSKTKENIFVIPKRALVLQSVVNLKVLKKEAEAFKKQIMIVTQDEQGLAISEKVGILAQHSLDGVDDSDELKIKMQPKIKINKKRESVEKERKKKILENIGSDNFYESGDVLNDNKREKSAGIELIEPVYESIKLVKRASKKIAPTKKTDRHGTMSDIVGATNITKSYSSQTNQPEEEIKEYIDESEEAEVAQVDFKQDLDPIKKQELDEFYRADNIGESKKKDNPVLVHGKIRKTFILFVIIIFIAVVVVGTVLMLPRAKINIELNSRIQSADMDIKGDGMITVNDLENKQIPLKIIEREKEKSMTFNSSGKNTISDQKARGMITVYNEYNTSAQSLVATTRFITNDGKIFRLTRGIIVPGMISVDGKLTPGVIEAEVIADESGAEFNIQPTNFSIPGFEGSPKHSKFYARSGNAMIGGGSRGSEVLVVSAADISSAKNESQNSLKNEIIDEIKKELENDDVVISEAIETAVVEVYSPEVGSIADTFDFKNKMKVSMMVFSNKDLRSIVEKNIIGKVDEKISQIKIEYGKMTPNFEEKTATIKVHGKVLFESDIDIEQIKKDLLGKKQEELEELLRHYPQIKELEAEIWPEFLPGKIPTYNKRVEIFISETEFQ